jgi:2-hydroxy fatty acid dioxygenase
MVFVPLIYATSMILLGLAPPIPISSNLPPLNLVDLAVSVYAVGYILLEPVAGVTMLPFHLGVAYYAHVLPTMFERGDIAKAAAAGNLASWVFQFIGHGFAEGRAPALFDNLFQVPHPQCPWIVDMSGVSE